MVYSKLSHALAAVNRVLLHGVRRYGNANLHDARRVREHLEHAKAHIDHALAGKVNDSESGHLHLEHAATRLLLAVEAIHHEAAKQAPPRKVKVQLQGS
jgi:hypothetical protein